MSTVWAVIRNKNAGDTGDWETLKGSGWDHLIIFSDLWNLVGQLKGLNQTGQVKRLAIVAHGDESGVVQLDRKLTAESASSFESEFSALAPFMDDFGRLIFFSCIAGRGEPGSKLLDLLSGRFLHDRYVIGFEAVGQIEKSGLMNHPGMVLANMSPQKENPNIVEADQTKDKRLSEHSWYSKWSFNGEIIRRPWKEEDAPTRTAQTTYGPKAVEEAIKSNRFEIEYVAIDKERAHSAALQGVVDALLRWVPGARDNISQHPKDGKLRRTTSLELNHLAGTRQHGGAVVKWIRVIRQVRCANPACPGHAEPWHFCIDYLKRFKNGPLVWP
jgi:hypothetical protein